MSFWCRCLILLFCTGFIIMWLLDIVVLKSTLVKITSCCFNFKKLWCGIEWSFDDIVCWPSYGITLFFFSCVILNEYPLPMTLLLLDASRWILFSVGRQRFQLGIPLVLAGRKFTVHWNQYFLWFYIALLFAVIIFLSSFVPPDDFKLALLTLELEYAKARANRNEEVSSLVCLWWDFH